MHDVTRNIAGAWLFAAGITLFAIGLVLAPLAENAVGEERRALERAVLYFDARDGSEHVMPDNIHLGRGFQKRLLVHGLLMVGSLLWMNGQMLFWKTTLSPGNGGMWAASAASGIRPRN